MKNNKVMKLIVVPHFDLIFYAIIRTNTNICWQSVYKNNLNKNPPTMFKKLWSKFNCVYTTIHNQSVAITSNKNNWNYNFLVFVFSRREVLFCLCSIICSHGRRRVEITCQREYLGIQVLIFFTQSTCGLYKTHRMIRLFTQQFTIVSICMYYRKNEFK